MPSIDEVAGTDDDKMVAGVSVSDSERSDIRTVSESDDDNNDTENDADHNSDYDSDDWSIGASIGFMYLLFQ